MYTSTQATQGKSYFGSLLVFRDNGSRMFVLISFLVLVLNLYEVGETLRIFLKISWKISDALKAEGRKTRVSAEEIRFQKELEEAIRMSADDTVSSGKDFFMEGLVFMSDFLSPNFFIALGKIRSQFQIFGYLLVILRFRLHWAILS